jgi:alcohol dehydrogenase (NADP+)
MIATRGYAVQSATAAPAPFDFQRRELGAHDVLLDIAFCGVCHTDIHMAHNEWGVSRYPLVPGHEIAGTVARVGSAVRKLAVGDRAGVGTFVDSCRECDACRAGEEVYCERGKIVLTYGGQDQAGQPTYGGYSSQIVVDEAYALRIPANLDLAAVSPLLCAGITTYSPLKHWRVGPGHKVGVVGLGGLGHMALKFAHAFGARTVQFTTSPGKVEDAKRLGADEVILTSEAGWEKQHAASFDFILDCVGSAHGISGYLALLKRDRTLCMVGIPAAPLAVHVFSLASGRKSVSGSGTGGIKETQEMLDFCGQHGIVSDIELIGYDQLESAWKRVVKGDVKYRFVLDNRKL